MSEVIVLGVDEKNDLCVKLGCGHTAGYPLLAVQAVAKIGGGAALRCPHGCCVEMVEASSLLRKRDGEVLS